jgi:hypothetical protein
MTTYRGGEQVRVRLPRNARGRVTCRRHRPGLDTDGLVGQIVELWPKREHSVAVQFSVWCQGTPWMDSFRPDELERAGAAAEAAQE